MSPVDICFPGFPLSSNNSHSNLHRRSHWNKGKLIFYAVLLPWGHHDESPQTGN